MSREEKCWNIQQGVEKEDWARIASQYVAPPTCKWDVFISHAGNSADKPFALALEELLKGTGWGLRIFLDEKSLQPSTDPAQSMQAAIESTHVALVLFSTEFFERSATISELERILDRHARGHVMFLPVFLRLTVEDCKRKLASLLGRGATRFSTSYQCCCSVTFAKMTAHCLVDVKTFLLTPV